MTLLVDKRMRHCPCCGLPLSPMTDDEYVVWLSAAGRRLLAEGHIELARWFAEQERRGDVPGEVDW